MEDAKYLSVFEASFTKKWAKLIKKRNLNSSSSSFQLISKERMADYYLGIKKRLKFRWQYLGLILINFKKLYEVWNRKKIIFNLRGVAAR